MSVYNSKKIYFHVKMYLLITGLFLEIRGFLNTRIFHIILFLFLLCCWQAIIFNNFFSIQWNVTQELQQFIYGWIVLCHTNSILICWVRFISHFKSHNRVSYKCTFYTCGLLNVLSNQNQRLFYLYTIAQLFRSFFIVFT